MTLAPKVFLVAGEPSGDRLGGALMQGLSRQAPQVRFAGVGGPMMTAAGIASIFDMRDLSVMGLTEVLPRYPMLRRRLAQTIQAVIDWEPDVLVTVDSPDFGLRVARGVRARAPSIRTVHYVAPSVWAWRSGRAAKMHGIIDQVLCLLPFEPPYMEAAGLRADFVGHPVVTEPRASAEDVALFRRGSGAGDAPILLALPGSRHSEVSRLMPVFGAALAPVVAERPELKVVIPAAAPVADRVQAMAANWPLKPLVLDPRRLDPEEAETHKRAAFAAADLALAASGTVSLELAMAMTPMVIAYDMSWLTWQIMSRLVKIDTVTLVNLVSRTRAVPEFLGPACRPGPIGAALRALLRGGPQRRDQLAAMAATMSALGDGGPPPGDRAAAAVLDGLDGSARRAPVTKRRPGG